MRQVPHPSNHLSIQPTNQPWGCKEDKQKGHFLGSNVSFADCNNIIIPKNIHTNSVWKGNLISVESRINSSVHFWWLSSICFRIVSKQRKYNFVYMCVCVCGSMCPYIQPYSTLVCSLTTNVNVLLPFTLLSCFKRVIIYQTEWPKCCGTQDYQHQHQN